MNVDILYKSNQDGDTLLDLIKNNYEQVDSEIVQIENIPFQHIIIKNDGSKFTRFINPLQAQINCINKETMFKILSRNNITCKKRPKELILRYYKILVFDTAIISIRQIIPARDKKTTSYIKPSQCEKAVDLSKKAVYHLGLDCAMVKIVYTASKEYLVFNVEPSPGIRPMDLQKLLGKITKAQHEDDLISARDVKLGADPEFMLSRNQRMIPASIYFPHHGRVGCDNIRTRDRQQHPIGELRPQPSISPLKLTENLKSALRTAVRLAPSRQLKWIAGSRPFKGYPIGGHIHFSNIKLNFAVLRSLDNFLAIPILMLEDPYAAALRRKKYGALADFRVKKYGGFEYRTLSSWLVSFEISKAVLCLAKIIVSQYPELNQNYLITLEAQKAFYKGDKEYFRPIFNNIWSIISQTAMYSQYADDIKILHDMIGNGDSWNEKSNFRVSWGLTEASAKKTKNNLRKKKPQNRINQNTISRSSHNTVASRRRHRMSAGSNRHTTLNSIRNSATNSNSEGRSSTDAAKLPNHFETNKNKFRFAYTTNLG